MKSETQELFLNNTQKKILIVFFVLILTFMFFFRNFFYQPTLLLKKFGELSVDPEIAFTNKKPTFLEFYAEWCEVCKEMSPKVSALKEKYENDVNFVFLNVDNPKWEIYIKKFNVNGIPQVNLLNNEAKLETTMIGKQEEDLLQNSLEDLKNGLTNNNAVSNLNISSIKENKNYQVSPRSHG